MAEMTINSATIRAQAEQLSQLNVQFQSQVSQLKDTEATLNAGWDGPANDAFHTAFMNDAGQMDKFYQAINQYIAELNNIAIRYENAEQSNTEIAANRTY